MNAWPFVNFEGPVSPAKRVAGIGPGADGRLLANLPAKPVGPLTTTKLSLTSLGLFIKAAVRKGSAWEADDLPAITNLLRTYPAANPAPSTGVSTGSFRSLRSEYRSTSRSA